MDQRGARLERWPTGSCAAWVSGNSPWLGATPVRPVAQGADLKEGHHIHRLLSTKFIRVSRLPVDSFFLSSY
jgi:hypothetical protein